MESDKHEIMTAGESGTPGRRRRYSLAYKQQMVEETLTGEWSVSQVARRHDVNANQLFKWRKLHLDGKLGRRDTQLLPVEISPTVAGRGAGQIDIAFTTGARLSVSGDVSPATLRLVLEVLR